MAGYLYYQARTLFDGKRIGKEGMFVAVPDKGYKGYGIIVQHNGKEMVIDDWEKAATFRRFKDKKGGEDYTLGYFKWDL